MFVGRPTDFFAQKSWFDPGGIALRHPTAGRSRVRVGTYSGRRVQPLVGGNGAVNAWWRPIEVAA